MNRGVITISEKRNGIHADRYCMDDHAGDCRHV